MTRFGERRGIPAIRRRHACPGDRLRPSGPGPAVRVETTTDGVGCMRTVCVDIKREPGCEDLPLPAYQTKGAAGMDLCAAVEEPVSIPPGAHALVSAGIRIAVPPGYEAQVRPRSGLALKHGIGILNAPGTIDSDYRGVVGVLLFNFGEKSFVVERGDRIAQMIIARVERAEFTIRETLEESGRNSGGFGSTGR